MSLHTKLTMITMVIVIPTSSVGCGPVPVLSPHVAASILFSFRKHQEGSINSAVLLICRGHKRQGLLVWTVM